MSETPSMAMDALENEVAREISPDPKLISDVASSRKELVRLAEERAKALHLPLIRALVAGSVARDTYLSPNFDIDLFVLFDPAIPRKEMVEAGLKLGKAILGDSATKKYAEHPYLKGTFRGYATEVVPGYAVGSGDRPITAVDRTPFHHAYLNERHDDRTRSEVRLMKRFLRSLGIYGAEVKTEGFSGYLTELLVLRQGSFRGALTEAQGWRVPMRLSPPGGEPAAEAGAALVLADPVDPHRNVAAALSRLNLATYVLASQAYLAHPSREFFFPPEVRGLTREDILRTVRDRGTAVAAVVFPVPDMVPDILYPQLRKSERSLTEQLRTNGFSVIGSASAVHEERAAILIEVMEEMLGTLRIHNGPPAGMPEARSFLNKWSNRDTLQGPYLAQDGRLIVEVQEERRDLVSRVKEALPAVAMGRDLRSIMTQKGMTLPLSEALTEQAVTLALQLLWKKRLPWLDFASSKVDEK